MFCKLFESVKLACNYTIEKCQKAILRLREEPHDEDNTIFDRAPIEEEKYEAPEVEVELIHKT